MSNIRGIEDLSKGPPRDPRATESYAGGDKSGIAIENPLNDLDPSIIMTDGPPPGGPTATIVMYRNGLVLNGVFYSRDDPRTDKWLEDIKKGLAPADLFANVESKDENLSIALEQRVFEDYDPKNAAVPTTGEETTGITLFQGNGRTLGGPTTSTTTPTELKAYDGQSVHVDTSQETTTIQVRFMNGQNRTQTFNVDASLESVFKWVEAQSGESNFKLLDGFPPKPLVRDGTTLKDAKVLNGRFIMRS